MENLEKQYQKIVEQYDWVSALQDFITNYGEEPCHTTQKTSTEN